MARPRKPAPGQVSTDDLEPPNVVTVALSQESIAQIDTIGETLGILVEFVSQLQAAFEQLKAQVREDVQVVVATEQSEGIIAFEETPRRRSSPRVELPDEMRTPIPRSDTIGREDRVTPFSRASRATQVRWLLEVMADGAWHSGESIADTYKDNEYHKRYLKRAVSRRLSEVHEDQEAPLERRDSQTRGSLFEYRLVQE